MNYTYFGTILKQPTKLPKGGHSQRIKQWPLFLSDAIVFMLYVGRSDNTC